MQKIKPGNSIQIQVTARLIPGINPNRAILRRRYLNMEDTVITELK
jgi:hypothetical protein